MEYRTAINGVRALPSVNGMTDVIAMVAWQLVFFEGEITSPANIITQLNFPDPSNFTEASQITEEQLISWCIEKEGGQPFISRLSEIHSQTIAQKKFLADTKSIEYPFMKGLDILASLYYDESAEGV